MSEKKIESSEKDVIDPYFDEIIIDKNKLNKQQLNVIDAIEDKGVQSLTILGYNGDDELLEEEDHEKVSNLLNGKKVKIEVFYGSTIQQIGNSLFVSIPKGIIEDLEFKKGDVMFFGHKKIVRHFHKKNDDKVSFAPFFKIGRYSDLIAMEELDLDEIPTDKQRIDGLYKRLRRYYLDMPYKIDIYEKFHIKRFLSLFKRIIDMLPKELRDAQMDSALHKIRSEIL